MKKIALYAAYWNGTMLRGFFDTEEEAQEYYDNHKGRFRDYAGEKHGFPYAIPIFAEEEVAD